MLWWVLFLASIIAWGESDPDCQKALENLSTDAFQSALVAVSVGDSAKVAHWLKDPRLTDQEKELLLKLQSHPEPVIPGHYHQHEIERILRESPTDIFAKLIAISRAGTSVSPYFHQIPHASYWASVELAKVEIIHHQERFLEYFPAHLYADDMTFRLILLTELAKHDRWTDDPRLSIPRDGADLYQDTALLTELLMAMIRSQYPWPAGSSELQRLFDLLPYFAQEKVYVDYQTFHITHRGWQAPYAIHQGPQRIVWERANEQLTSILNKVPAASLMEAEARNAWFHFYVKMSTAAEQAAIANRILLSRAPGALPFPSYLTFH